MNCCWIPPLVERDSSRPWSEYDALVYSIFRRDFIEGRPVYHGKPVKIRYQPMLEGRAEAFWHLTCRDYDHKSGLQRTVCQISKGAGVSDGRRRSSRMLRGAPKVPAAEAL